MVVAHSGQLRLIFRSKRKNDRVDAEEPPDDMHALRRYFKRIQQGHKDRKKIALVATSHYLARVMLAMLRTGEAWRETELKEVA